MHRPLWVCPDGRIFLETFSPIYKQAYDFLIAIAEPQSRPEVVHEYMLTEHSLYAAVSVGLETDTIISVLERLSKVNLSDDIKGFIKNSTQNYGKVSQTLKLICTCLLLCADVQAEHINICFYAQHKHFCVVQVKLVLQHNRFYVESRSQEILERLLKDRTIFEAHMKSDSGGTFIVSKGLREKVPGVNTL